jgi:NAD(P)-dependent dehydrogenase (short-subunit alcohol dehydrogenase family)
MAIAKQLFIEGFTVAFHSKSSVLIGQSLAEAHPGSSYFQSDLSDQSQSSNLIAEVLSHHGRLDVLVNNAGNSATIPHPSLNRVVCQ